MKSSFHQVAKALLLIFATPLFAEVKPDISLIRSLHGQVKPLGAGNWEVGFQFRGQALTDEDLEKVAKFTGIVALNLRDTQITSAGLQHLKNLRNLERLHLERTQINDGGLIHLSKLTNLHYLNLYGTEVTDSGILQLATLKNLRHLYVWQSKVTAAGAEQLQAALPDLKVSLGINLDAIEVKEEKEEPKVFTKLEWLPEGGAKEPPKKSIAGIGMQVIFINQRKQPVKVYWVDYGGGLKLYGEIQPGGKREQNSFSKAVWLITDIEEQRLGYFVTTDKSSTATIPVE